MVEQERRDLVRFFSVGYAGLTDAEKGRYEQRRTLQMDKDVTGGFLVAPEAFSSQIIAGLFDALFMRQISTQFELKYAQSFTAPALDADPDDADFSSELKTGSEDSTMSYEKRALYPRPVAKRIKISNTLLNRSQNAQNFVMQRLIYKFGVTEEKSFLTGDGGGKPLGIFSVSADGITSSRDTSTHNSATELKPDNVIETIYSLKAQYRRNASIILHRDVLRKLRQLKTGDGQYLFMPGLTADRPDTILGLKFHESEYAPNVFSSGQYMFCVGDFSFYWICTALDMTVSVLKELYAETNETGLIGRLEIDGMPVLAEAFARSKLA
jgi:HK97 family phage major capsid protein